MKNNVIIPIFAGAAAVAALTYLFATDDGKELKKEIAKAIDKHLPEVGEHFKNLGATLQERFAELSTNARDIADGIQV